MNVVLIGYRGAGKSAVGRLLAERLGYRLLATDELIVERFEMSIPEIVEKHGWERFRDAETEVAEEVSREDGCVIDTGGGVILRPQNVASLKKNGRLFWLQCSPKVIMERLKDVTDRPSLTGEKSFLEEVEEILKERTPKYRAAADHVIDTTELGLAEVADRIAGILKGTESRSTAGNR
jgi:shikimate kinase